jgi:hypothetical protein
MSLPLCEDTRKVCVCEFLLSQRLYSLHHFNLSQDLSEFLVYRRHFVG